VESVILYSPSDDPLTLDFASALLWRNGVQSYAHLHFYSVDFERKPFQGDVMIMVIHLAFKSSLRLGV
jgi:hypothetical protein